MSKQVLGAYFRSLVHESVKNRPLAASRHQAFIAAHLVGGFAALTVFPVYLATIGQPNLLTALVFSWLMTPILIAVFLSKTGRLGAAHLISALNLAGVVTIAAGLTGGATSFLVAWMVVVPFEAALSADRRVVLSAIGVAIVSIALLAAAESLGMLPPPRPLTYAPSVLAMFGALSAIVYAGGLAVSVQSVYERSDDEIRKGEQRYRLLAENATDMITRHDPRGQVVFASLASKSIFGEPPAVLEGNGLLDRVHVADKPNYLMALSRCNLKGEAVSVELRIVRNLKDQAQSGSEQAYRWVEMRCRPVMNGERQEPSGHAREIVAVTRDITARKEQEDAILSARDAAEGANRAKTQFLANMSHELRTPLNAIIGFSEILSRELYGRIGEEKYREYSRLIHESGEHLLSVVNEVLDMSKIEAGKFDIVTEHFQLPQLITLCSEIIGAQAKKKSIEVATDISPDVTEIVADKRACKQILLNLLANAVKFTDQGGSVCVAARNVGSEVEISVSDNGIGIAEKDIPKLGDPFVQAESSYDRSYEGAGLGLSVVKGLVRLHGGSFRIESKLGQGTRAVFRLPVEGPAAAADEEAISQVLEGAVCDEREKIAVNA